MEMEQLYKLIKLISPNNFITKDNGIFIPIDSVNTKLLDKHREDINTLCAQSDLQFSTIQPQTEDLQAPQYDANGEFTGMETVTKFVVKNNYEQKGGFWVGKSKNTFDTFAQALS